MFDHNQTGATFQEKKKKRMWDEIKFKHGISLRSVKIVSGKNTSL